MSETPYAECDALLAVMRGDLDEAERMLAELWPGERLGLGAAAATLADMTSERSHCPGCGRYVPLAEPGVVEARWGESGPSRRWHRVCRDNADQSS